MAWVCKDEDGEEVVSDAKPVRWDLGYWSRQGNIVVLPKGSILKLIGRELSWTDEPVELK